MIIPPAELIQKIREVQALERMKILDPFEVKKLTERILNHHYGVGED